MQTQDRTSQNLFTALELACSGVLLVLAAVFLLSNLGTYAGSLLTWEPAVLDGFEEAFLSGMGVRAYAARALVWEEGLVSNGDRSALYGWPAYALLKSFGFTPFLMRLPAAIAVLLTIAAGIVLGQLLLGRWGGVALGGALALSPAVLYYGRYATSLAATTLTVLLSAVATVLFLEKKDLVVGRGLFLLTALVASTFHYAPGRLVFLFFLLLLPAGIFFSPPPRARKLAVLGLIYGLLLCFWNYQKSLGGSEKFFSARGEQLLNFFKDRGYIEQFLGSPVEPSKLKLSEKLVMTKNVLRARLPEMAFELKPSFSLPDVTDVIGSDPPHLPFFPAPLFLFALWGAALSLRNPLNPRTLAFFGLALAPSLPTLLTTRVDGHRLHLIAIPVAFWAASGLLDLFRRFPKKAAFLGGAAFVVSLPYVYKPLHERERTDVAPVVRSLLEGLKLATGPVSLGIAHDHSIVGLARLEMLEKLRTQGPEAVANWHQTSTLVPDGIMSLLGDEKAIKDGSLAEEFLAPLSKVEFLLGPERAMPGVFPALKKAGFTLMPAGTTAFPLVLVSFRRPLGGPAESAHLSLAAKPGLIFLSDLKPLNTQFDFAAPRSDASWDGSPLATGGQVYEKGIGMHAPASMTYAVPPGAILFQARIGLGPGASGCPSSHAGFIVKDGAGNFLYSVPSMGSRDLPLDVWIKLEGVEVLTLVSTEAGDGRDCDHTVWAAAAFVMGPSEAY